MSQELGPLTLTAISEYATQLAEKVIADRRTEDSRRATAAPSRRDLPRPQLPTYDHSTGSSWSGFLSRFATYRDICGLDRDQSKKYLHLALTGAAATVGIDYGASQFANKSYVEYKAILGAVFSPTSEKQLHRVRFSERKQAANETVQRYLVSKKSLFSVAYGNTTNRDLLLNLYFCLLYTSPSPRD